MDVGLLVLRIVLGGALLAQAHGKLGRAGRPGTEAFFDEMGFVPAPRLVTLAGLTEALVGVALFAGLATVAATIPAVGLLVAATAVNARNGFANSNGGAEYPVVATSVVVALALSGRGALSVDAWLGWSKPSVALGAAAVVAGAVTSLPLLARRARRLRERRIDRALSPAVAEAA